jgi:glucose/arabinose dehydrogenase
MLRSLYAIPFVLAACSSEPVPAQTPRGAGTQAPITGEQPAAAKPFVATPMAKFSTPWAMTFLPDGHLLVTEKAGGLIRISADGRTKTPIAGTPTVNSEGQGGLMDVVLDPAFATNQTVYLSYVEGKPDGTKGVVLAKARLAADTLADLKVIFRASSFVTGNGHYSGRIAFSPDGKYLFFTNGERQKFDPAQDPKSTLGKVLRLTLDGQPAPGNPLAATGFHPAIWSYGHRNLLGIAFDAQGRLWEQEMGPKGGDEVNLILPGRNYGWPVVSNGSHYDGRDIPDHPTRPDLEAPKVSWNPVISPAGLMFYSGSMFPDWKGNIFIGGLSSQSLVRVEVTGDTAREAARYAMGARIREVEQGPDGAIWVLEDGESGGRLLKLTPIKR